MQRINASFPFHGAMTRLAFCFVLLTTLSTFVLTSFADVSSEGLLLYLDLNDGLGPIALDISGNGNDGTLLGPTWTLGRIMNALHFDGIDDYVDAGTMDVEGSELTLSVWFKSDNLANCGSRDCRIISKATGVLAQDHYWMLSTINSGGTKLRFRLKTGGVTTTLIAGSGNLSDNVWVHAVAVYDGFTMRFYKDGLEVGSVSKTGSISQANNVSVWIGSNPPSAASRPWDGMIDDVRIYNRALSPEEVNQIYAVGAEPSGNQPPVASFAADPILGEPPLEVGFDATGSNDPDGTIESYQWEFGDGNTGRGMSVSHTYTDVGTYSASLTVTDDYGTIGRVTKTIWITNEPEDGGSAFDVWYGSEQTFGNDQLGTPQRWVNINGNIYHPEGVQALWYSLNGGAEVPLSTGPNGNRLQEKGDFNLEVGLGDVLAGANEMWLRARTNSGNEVMETLTFNYESGNVWPSSYTIDWSSVSSIQEVAQVVDGQWRIEDGAIRTEQIGYDRLVAIGDMTWDNYEVTVPITIHNVALPSPWGGPGVGLITRWQGHTPGGQKPSWQWWPLGAYAYYHWFEDNRGRFRIMGGNLYFLDQGPMVPHLELNVPYIFKMRSETDSSGNSTYSLKVWQGGPGDEPSEWSLVGPETNDDQTSGSLLLVAHYTDVSFGNVTIVPLNDGGNLQPVASFAADPISGEPPLEVGFDAGASGDPDGTVESHEWEFGDGSTASGSTTSHTYAAVGTYTVTLTVTDNDGATATATETITVSEHVNQPPVASITAAPIWGEPPLLVDLDAAGSTDPDGFIASYAWDFGDGNTDTDSGSTVSHTYSAVGTYTVTLTVTDNEGATATATETITVDDAPQSGRITQDLVAYYPFTEGGGSTVLDQSASGSPMDLTITGSVNWNVGENGVVMMGGRIGTVGQATKVIDALQATNQSSFEIWISADNLSQSGPARMMSVGGDVSNQNFVLGQSGDDVQVRLRHTAKDAKNKPRLTTSNNFLTTNLTHIVHTYDGITERLYVNGVQHPTTVVLSGNYSNWDVTDKFNIGNEGSSDRPWYGIIHTVAVYDRALSPGEVNQNYAAGTNPSGNQSPVASFTVDPNPGGEAPLPCAFDAGASYDPNGVIDSYDWDFGDGSTASGITASHTYPDVGIYTATLTVIDDEGGTGIATETITVTAHVNQLPVASLTADPSSGEPPLTVALEATGSADPDGTVDSYDWDFGDGSTASGITASHTYPDVGIYTVSLTVTDNEGGTGTATETITVTEHANQLPVASITAIPTSGEPPLLVTLNAAGSTDPDGVIDFYDWDFGDGSTGSGYSVSHTYAEVGTYTVTLTVTDNEGATATATETIDCFLNAPCSNVVTNGDFSAGKVPWRFYTNGSGSYFVVDGEARVAITTQGSNVQLHQAQLALEGNTTYRLTFRARHTTGRDVSVHLIKNSAPYTNWGLSKIIDLTDTMQPFSIEFTTPLGAMKDARLMFYMGPYDQNGTSYFFDDVVLCALP